MRFGAMRHQTRVPRRTKLTPITLERFHTEVRDNVIPKIAEPVRNKVRAQVAHYFAFERIGAGHMDAGFAMLHQCVNVEGSKRATVNASIVKSL